MDFSQVFIALLIGIMLSIACGFRIFVPVLVVGLGVRFLNLHANPVLNWTASNTALICLATATLVEIVTYCIPVLDSFLSRLAIPIAVIASTILTGGMLVDMPPVLQWGLAAIAGGGSTATVAFLKKPSRWTRDACNMASLPTGGASSLGTVAITVLGTICAVAISALAAAVFIWVKPLLTL